jgi:hypothetical protein
LRADLVPFLETHAPVSEELKQRMQEDPLQHRFTLVFDREAYSPDFFREMKDKRIAESIPDSIRTVNPAWRQLDGQIRGKSGQLQRLLALFGQLSLNSALSESAVTLYEQRKGQQKEGIDSLSKELEALKLERKNTPRHLPVSQLPEADRLSRLLPERKHFIDTIKMIGYRAETAMASLLEPKLARSGDDARALLRQIYNGCSPPRD